MTISTINIIYLVIAFCIIAANVFVALLFAQKRSLLNAPSNRLLLSLLVCDTLSGFNVVSQVVIAENYGQVKSARVANDLFTCFLMQVVSMQLCGITMDRFVSLFFALRYKEIVTLKTSDRYITITWLLALCIQLVQFSWNYREFDDQRTEEQIALMIKIDRWYALGVYVAFLILPVTFLTFAFASMFCEIRRILNHTPTQLTDTEQKRVTAKKRRVLMTFGFMFFCFAIFTIPFYTLRLLDDFGHIGYHPTWLYTLSDLVYIMRLLPSLINPILYTTNTLELRALMSQVFGRSCAKILRPLRRLTGVCNSPNRITTNSNVRETSLVTLSQQDSVTGILAAITPPATEDNEKSV